MFPCVLVILDGWGWREERRHNAILASEPRAFLNLLDRHPWTLLDASGLSVGLPPGVMGNSEVGHLHIGAGRTVNQLLTQIGLDIQGGAFARNAVLQDVFARVKKSGGTLHAMGLLSDGGVHSHQYHLEAVLRAARAAGVERISVHAFLDGRDTPPASGVSYLERLLAFLKKENAGSFATFMGRFYAMDRDKRWERTKIAYDALVHGAGTPAPDAFNALRASYKGGVTDEFAVPHIADASPSGRVKAGDAVFFFNFRPDRARQITRALTEMDFAEFETGKRPALAAFAGMTVYDDSFNLPAAYRKETLTGVLGEQLSRLKIPQFRVAETEKYAHVTYFLNGGVEAAYDGEERCLVPSNRAVRTYAEAPEMSAGEITAAVLERLEKGAKRQVIVVNYANPDMVGHTGDFEATRRACAVTDSCIGRVSEKTLSVGGSFFLTADHGNAEEMTDSQGNPHTAHTTNPVPFVAAFTGSGGRALEKSGELSNVAPTLLDALELAAPREMAKPSLWRAR